MTPTPKTLAALLLALPLLACGGGGKDDPAALSVTCPTGSTTLRYQGGGDGGSFPADFGKTFFDTHCIRCHAAGATDPAATALSRSTPFTTLPGIQAHTDHILEQAGADDSRVNQAMPIDGQPVPDDQRRLLARWIVCANAQ